MEAAIYNRNAGEGRRGTGRWPSTLITLKMQPIRLPNALGPEGS